MIITYDECIKRYGSDYSIRKELKENRLYKIEKGFYSLQKNYDEMEFILAKYPRAVFTGESAYYYMGLTNVKPVKYVLATRRNDTRMKENYIKQVFMDENLFDAGIIKIEYENITIPIYSIERLLVDLVRFKGKYSFDYYKEIIHSYREAIGSLDFYLIEECASRYKMNDSILEAIKLEVL